MSHLEQREKFDHEAVGMISTELAASLSFTVPLPPRSLRSNTRTHWGQRHRDKQAYSLQIYVQWLHAYHPSAYTPWERARVTYVWKHAGVAPDVSNLGANTKALQDFLCMAPDNGLQKNDCYYLGLVADDKGIEPVYRTEKVAHRKDECVEITIERLA